MLQWIFRRALPHQPDVAQERLTPAVRAWLVHLRDCGRKQEFPPAAELPCAKAAIEEAIYSTLRSTMPAEARQVIARTLDTLAYYQDGPPAPKMPSSPSDSEDSLAVLDYAKLREEWRSSKLSLVASDQRRYAKIVARLAPDLPSRQRH